MAGRGTNTHAYTHSVAESHHVFLNLLTLKFYCLPDNYEIVGKLQSEKRVIEKKCILLCKQQIVTVQILYDMYDSVARK